MPQRPEWRALVLPFEAIHELLAYRAESASLRRQAMPWRGALGQRPHRSAPQRQRPVGAGEEKTTACADQPVRGDGGWQARPWRSRRPLRLSARFVRAPFDR